MTRGGRQSLLPVHHLVTPVLVCLDHEGLQTVERLSLATIAVLDKLPNVIQQLSDLQRIPAITPLVSRNPEARRPTLCIGEQSADRFDTNGWVFHTSLELPRFPEDSFIVGFQAEA